MIYNALAIAALSEQWENLNRKRAMYDNSKQKQLILML